MTTPNTPTDTSPSNAPAPARGGRVSRLSQLTVPSMPQSVASTAAKSSFVQDLKTALVPPPPVAIKKDPKLKDMALVKYSRLSVQPVTADEWKLVCKMGGVK